MTKNQKGFSHLLVLLVAVTAIGLVSFAGYRLRSHNKTVNLSNKTTAQTSQQHKETTTVTTKNTAEKVEVGSETSANASTSSKSTVVPSSTPAPSSNAASTSFNKGPRVINFVKGGGSQEGDTVHVSANLSESVPQGGTCNYSFVLNGTIRVSKSNGITDGLKCELVVPVSEFPKSGNYNLNVSFTSKDNTVTASQAAYEITVK